MMNSMLYDKTFSDFMYSSNHMRSTDYSRSDIIRRCQDIMMPIYMDLYSILFENLGELHRNSKLTDLVLRFAKLHGLCSQEGIGLMRIYTPLTGYFLDDIKVLMINNKITDHIDEEQAKILTTIAERIIAMFYAKCESYLDVPRYLPSLKDIEEIIKKICNIE